MATITFFLPGKTFSVEGTEHEIANLAYAIQSGFDTKGGAWVSNGRWTAWVPSSTPLKVGLAADALEGITALPVVVTETR